MIALCPKCGAVLEHDILTDQHFCPKNCVKRSDYVIAALRAKKQEQEERRKR